MDIDVKKLKGIDLYYYLTSEYSGTEYAETVSLLMYAEPDREKALVLLEKMVQDGKRLVAIYPGNGDVVPRGAELVGDIPDGALYIA
jgi:hypothetical protein